MLVYNNEFSGSKIVSDCYTHNTYVSLSTAVPNSTD